MIVSLSLTAVTAGAALPVMSRWAGGQQLRRGAAGLSGDLARALSMAISRNGHVRVRVTGAGTYTLESSSDANSWTPIGSVALPKGISAASGSEVRFDRRGFPSVRDVLVLADASNETRSVRTSAMGRVSVQ